MLLPPNELEPNAPIQDYFHSQIYFDPKRQGAESAAKALQKLLQPADVRPLPVDPAIRALSPGSMLMLITGQTFHNELSPAPVVTITTRQPPVVRADAASGRELLIPYRDRVRFRLMVPTVLEQASYPDRLPGDKPARLYWIDDKHKAVRLVFRTGSGEFWGIQQTDWEDAPALGDRSFTQRLKDGRTYQLYYAGSHLHMVVLKQGKTSYWVINTLMDSLSNETMLAIAKGLKPMKKGKLGG
jgi:hypothetical protein